MDCLFDNESVETLNSGSPGSKVRLKGGGDLGLNMEGAPTWEDPKDPRRGSDLVDKFLTPILWRLGEDEFLRLIRSHSLDFRPLVWTMGSVASGSMESHGQATS